LISSGCRLIVILRLRIFIWAVSVFWVRSRPKAPMSR
jgi:hypothetical protein